MNTNTSPAQDPEAPTRDHVAKKWIDEMVLELRLRDVTGPAIGDAVSQVEGHCAESGEEPREAFGDPREYARSLDFTDEQLDPTTTSDLAGLIAPSLVGMLGLVAAGQAATAFGRHDRAALTWGQLVTVAVVGLFCLALGRLLPVLMRRLWLMALLLVGFVALTTAATVLLDGVALWTSAGVAALAAVALLALNVVLARRNRTVLDDRVTDPVTGAEHHVTGGGGSRTLARVMEWMFPAAAVVNALLCLAIAHVA